MNTNLDFAKQMQERTMLFALRVIRMSQKLPKSEEATVMRRQILRSATSVAANYRAVCRAKSAADFASKMKTLIEEADETALWLEMLVRSEIAKEAQLKELRAEADEILRICSASHSTITRNQRKGGS
ncbi:MAG: four helix bundle protein [Verrucomicrobiaceae bacterium]|nr:four helix bundle protein [Verrucomicrobiaceae bacterium]